MKWRYREVLQKVGLEFTQQYVEDAKHFIRDFEFMSASCLEKLDSGQQILFAVDDFARRLEGDSVDLIHDLLLHLGALQPLLKFEQLTAMTKTAMTKTTDSYTHGTGGLCFQDIPPRISEQSFHPASLNLSCQSLREISPLFSAMGSLVQGDAQGTATSIQEFLAARTGRGHTHTFGLSMAEVDLDGCQFDSLHLILCPAVCSPLERSFILRMLMELSYRRTNLHEQTQWLIDLMSQDRALQLFCEARIYKAGNHDHDNTFEANAQSRRFLALFTRCVNLQQHVAADTNLPESERCLRLALLNDSLGLLEAKDPRGCSAISIRTKQQHHDKAREMRGALLSSGEACGTLEGVLTLLDAYASLQSSGFARAVLSCIDTSKTFDDRMALAREAETIHHESMTEQARFLHLLGLSSEEISCAPSMLAARFDNMLRGVRPLQLSRVLRGVPSDGQRSRMLSHLHTELGSIRETYDRIPTRNRDTNIRRLCKGMLSLGRQLEEQIHAGTMEPFALDNPYIPE